MKMKFIYVAAFAMVTLLSNCKKSENYKPDLSQAVNDVSLAVSSTANKVVTIAGLANSPGFINGTLSVARFNGPAGIQLLNDGTMYVADEFNNAIRKITPAGVVSTETLKPDSFGVNIYQPLYVGETDSKELHIICAKTNDLEPGESWIFNATRDFTARYSVPNTAQASLAKDPYQDAFFFSIGYSIAKHVAKSAYEIGGAPVYGESQLFPPNTERGASFRGLAIGRNKVIYFARNGGLYKHTPGGVDAQINVTNLPPIGDITSIVLNADCQTIYLAESGFIESITDGKLTKLAGPNTTHPDGRDGTGFAADVNAFSLALGDHENTLYFSDSKTHTIRKLMLK